jgi:hypothetical protein
MSSLVVLVDKVGVPRQTREFHHSPVRIGRGSRNDLHLPLGFVSDVHAEIEFDGQSARYVDLGSTNGSFVAGQRLPPHLPITVESELIVEIGVLRMTITHARATRARERDPLSPPTIVPFASEPRTVPARPTDAPPYEASEPPTAPASSAPVNAIAGELHAPTPQPDRAEERRELAARAEAVAALGDGAAAAGPAEAALTLCRVFLWLHRAYDRSGREMGVRPFVRSRGAALHAQAGATGDANALLATLCDSPAAREELETIAADMAAHHDALLAAFTAGARATLARFGAPAAASRLGSTALGGGGETVSSEAARDSSVGDDALALAFFGPAFAEAYARAHRRPTGE